MSDTTNEKPDAIWYTGNDGKIYTSKVIGTAYGNANADRIAAAHNATVAALTAANARIEALEKENFDLTCQRNAAWSELEERGDCN